LGERGGGYEAGKTLVSVLGSWGAGIGWLLVGDGFKTGGNNTVERGAGCIRVMIYLAQKKTGSGGQETEGGGKGGSLHCDGGGSVGGNWEGLTLERLRRGVFGAAV